VKAAVAIPTRRRAGYLDVALASVMPQARAAGAEVLVVDDGPDDATRAVAERHGARYVRPDPPRGLNAARNIALDASGAPLVCFVDDDVAVRPGWLEALLRAAAECPDEVGMFGGPIRARLEGHRFRACGREGPPVTFLDLGDVDRDCDHVWGANMAVRASAVERAGRFDEALVMGAGDELEWQTRLSAAGGRIRYVAAAALDHRRAGDDARLRALCAAAYHRGRASRRFDVHRGDVPSLGAELRVLAGCLLHGPRFACMNGPVMSAHSLGRVMAAVRRETPAPPEDFLSGASGTVGGKRGELRRLLDGVLDAHGTGARRRLAKAATGGPRRRVHVLAVVRDDVENRWDRAAAELKRSHHDVFIQAGAPAGGKFQTLNRMLADAPPDGADWLLVVDDDVDLPKGFLDLFLYAAESAGLRIAQPAHRLYSHAAWEVTRRRALSVVRETTFVEIGPVTAFHRETFATLLPFPELRMGWGLDAHWSALAREHGWPIGVVDATPIGHALRPAGDAYPREDAIAEGRAFLAGRPYVRRDEVRTVAVRRGRDL
jgi:GT2 family glycosyltransferase